MSTTQKSQEIVKIYDDVSSLRMQLRGISFVCDTLRVLLSLKCSEELVDSCMQLLRNLVADTWLKANTLDQQLLEKLTEIDAQLEQEGNEDIG